MPLPHKTRANSASRHTQTRQRMLALALCVACAYVWFSVFGLLMGILLHVATLVLLACALPTGLPALRCSRLASFLGRTLVGVRFTRDSLALLARLAAAVERPLSERQQYVFAYEPHGPAALALCLTASAPGVDSLPVALARDCVVVGHWSIAFLPLIAPLYALCGVLPSRPTSVLLGAIADGRHFALCPSGIEGKFASTMRSNELNRVYDGDGRQEVRVRKRRPTSVATDAPSVGGRLCAAACRLLTLVTGKTLIFREPASEKRRLHSQTGLGFFSYAARYNLHVVPMLSVHEDVAFWNVLQSLRITPLVAPLGRFLVLPLCDDMEVRVGEPIDASLFSADDPTAIQRFADEYYRALEALAFPGFKVVFEND